MQQIDFLPRRFHEQVAARRARIWRVTLLVSFGLVVCLAGTGQYLFYRSAKADLEGVFSQHAAAVDKAAKLAQLQRDLDEARQFAALYTYLQHPWPRSQLLAAVTRNLPASVTITELSVSDEIQPALAAGGAAQVPAAAEQETPDQAARRDLHALRGRHDTTRCVVQLTGVTTDAAALHLFVMVLGNSSLFAEAKLDSLEAIRGGKDRHISRFLVQLVVRPGYGQPDGPSGPPPEVADADTRGEGPTS